MRLREPEERFALVGIFRKKLYGAVSAITAEPTDSLKLRISRSVLDRKDQFASWRPDGSIRVRLGSEGELKREDCVEPDSVCRPCGPRLVPRACGELRSGFCRSIKQPQ